MNQPTGWALLRNRYLNKGTAFTAAERDRLGLRGLLPPVVETLDDQLRRVRFKYDSKKTDLGRHIFLRLLQERSSVLFYSFLQRHLAELLPIVYTPTVGLACQEWSRIYRQEHGLYLSWPDRDHVGDMLDHALEGHDGGVDVIVATDGERILGLGDLGAGGMGIPIGKLALYSAVGGLDPSRTLPVLLDVGTDNEALLSAPLYLGWRHRRVRGDAYDELVDAFVEAVAERLPGVLLQWEDFAQNNARRLLERHRRQLASFNDDVQGTAAVTVAAVRTGLATAGIEPRDARIVIVGAGSAGTGVADELVRFLVTAGLDEPTAVARCFLVDRDGLLHDGLTGLPPFQARYQRCHDEVPGAGTLLGVITGVRPQVLIGVSGQPGLFTEAVIRELAAHTARPVVLPLSNPTPHAEAVPADVLAWSDGRALVGSGSPFEDVAQVNNIYIFPGLGLGTVTVRAREVTDAMVSAAAAAIAEMAVSSGGGRLLPPIDAAPACARAVAIAVARQAVDDGVCTAVDDDEIERRVAAAWEPRYTSFE